MLNMSNNKECSQGKGGSGEGRGSRVGWVDGLGWMGVGGGMEWGLDGGGREGGGSERPLNVNWRPAERGPLVSMTTFHGPLPWETAQWAIFISIVSTSF